MFDTVISGQNFSGCVRASFVAQPKKANLGSFRKAIAPGAFLFLYFLFLFFTKIYFRFENLHKYTPAAGRLGPGHPAAGGRAARVYPQKKDENKLQTGPWGRSLGSGAVGPPWPPGSWAAGPPALYKVLAAPHPHLAY